MIVIDKQWKLTAVCALFFVLGIMFGKLIW
jgi:hypothetical protein